VLWLPGFSQIKPHQDGFIVTRSFLELVSSRFDSLKHYKIVIKDSQVALDSCFSAINMSSWISKKQDEKVELMQEEIEEQNRMIESYSRQDLIYRDIHKKLKQETRKKKTWQIIGITTGIGLLTSLIINLI
jgi:hypothetical protein